MFVSLEPRRSPFGPSTETVGSTSLARTVRLSAGGVTVTLNHLGVATSTEKTSSSPSGEIVPPAELVTAVARFGAPFGSLVSPSGWGAGDWRLAPVAAAASASPNP